MPLVDLLLAAALANLAIYLVSLVAGSLPVAWLSPAWQMQFTATAVNNAGFALLGFVLLHLAAWFDPEDPRLERFTRWARQWAVLACLGFVLLIPLQGWAGWRLYSEAAQQPLQGRQAVEKRYAASRRAIETASSAEELARRLQALDGVRLAPELLAQPLPQLKRQLLGGMAQGRQQMLSQLPPPPAPVELWAAVQESLRRMLTALVVALGFAAGAQLPWMEMSLLGWLLATAEQRGEQRLLQRQERRRRAEQQRSERDRQRALALGQAEQGAPLAVGGAEGEPAGLLYSFDLATLASGSAAGSAPPWRFVAREDPSLQLLVAPAGPGLELRFSRPVRPEGVLVGRPPQAGSASAFRLRQGGQEACQGPMAWVEGFGYPLEWPALLAPQEPLGLEGALPEALVPLAREIAAGVAAGLPLRELTVFEPAPTLAGALREDLQSWGARLRGRG